MLLQPSQDLAALASDQVMRFPRTLRFLLKGLGVSQKGGSDLLSYLAFEKQYIDRLVTLGYDDTRSRFDEIRAFVSGGAGDLSRAG
jgi:NTE family protein